MAREVLTSRSGTRGRSEQEVAAALGLAQALANSDFATVTVETVTIPPRS